MGFWEWLTSFLEWLGLKNKTGKLLLLGLDNSGKTTLLQRLKTGNFIQFDQTKTYHIEELTIEGIRFSAYDLGGHEMARQSWHEFCLDASAIVYMVDACDRERFPLAKRELDGLLQDEILRGVPFLILGNKVDLDGAVSQDVLCNQLGIFNMTPEDQQAVPAGTRAIRVYMCSVKKKSGYAQGFRWLSKFIKSK